MADDPQPITAAATSHPRVLLVVDDESLDRFGVIAKYMVVGLADSAVRVTVLARTRNPPAALELGPCDAIHDPPSRWWARNRVPAQLRELAGEARIDIVHCLSTDLAEWATRRPELARFPLAAHISDVVDLGRWQLIGSVRPRIWALPATPTLFRGVLDAHRVPVRRVKLVRLGVLGQKGTPVFAEEGYTPSAVAVTRLDSHCGLDCVLRAMRGVLDDGRETVLFVIGKGPAERRLRRVVRELQLQGSVIFVGTLSQWLPAMLGCDMMLVPAPPTRWSCLVLHAMAAGRVILATRENQEDYLLHDQTACLFQAGSAEDLQRQWERLLAEPHTARQLAANAQQFVKTHNSLSVMVEALIELYGEMMAK